ncbi:hypothetical protein F4604DRAFT_1756859 [Suillus subluteus]|nr:hypothetical protein F4604DRAFT_1756859 [Suillus subluteus]
MSSSQPHTQSTSPMDANGVVRCSHGETAMTRTSRTSLNPNREFYTCSRSIQSERCKFFYWADDPIFSQQQNIPVPHSVPATAPAPAPSRPPPSQRQRAESARALSTPHRSPRKRIADIAAALNEPGPQAPSTPQHDSPQQNATVLNYHTRSFLFGSQSSLASTIGDWDGISSEDDPEQSSPSRSADQSFRNLDQRTPKKPRITPVEQRSGVQIPFPPTPPQTIRRRGDSSGQGIFQTDYPQTPTRNKGKERENSGGEQTTPGANARIPGPFESGSSTLERASDVPARTSKTLERTSSNPFIVNQTTGESIASHLEALEALQSPSHIRKMEKKLSALDQSNKFKAKYLEDLKAAKADVESENARLTAENAGLQSENARLAQANAHLQERLLQSERSSRVKDIEIAAIKSRRPPNI